MKPSQSAFEAWCKVNGFRVMRRDDTASPDLYFHYETEQRWKCWQAATAACTSAQPVPRVGGMHATTEPEPGLDKLAPPAKEKA